MLFQRLRRIPGAADLYFLFLGAYILAYSFLLFPRMARKWLLGEWLINYQGGFVRRGLPGELAYRLGHLTGLAPAVWIIGAVLLLYAVLFLSFRALFAASSHRLWTWTLLLSPATLAFPLLDFLAGFHKELLFLAALALLSSLLLQRQVSSLAATAYLALVIPLITFAHEPLFCFAPYFVAALVLGGRTLGQAARQSAPGLLLGFAAAVLCAAHPGNLGTAQGICASLGYPYSPEGAIGNINQVCSGGAIPFLAYTRSMAAQAVRERVIRDHFLALYPALALLALLPIAFGGFTLFRDGRRRDVCILGVAAFVSFALSLPLFVYGEDWGRWIALHIFSLALLLLLLDARAPHRQSTPLSRARRLAAYAFIALYSTAWTLPHFPENIPRFGYWSLVASVRTFPARYANRHQVRAAPARPPSARRIAGA